MSITKRSASALMLAGALVTSGIAVADDDDKSRTYEVTVTNITGGPIFTPIMVAAHRPRVKLFQLGEPASNGLEQLAEGGNTQPLTDELLAEGASDVVTSGDVLPPGHSVTLRVKGNRHNNRISVASMLIPTNDAFFAVNSVRAPNRYGSKTIYSPAYDAGSEYNDELCVNIPGPPTVCAGEGYNPESGEGYVHVNPGIHGIGDLSAASYDWRNPVAKITIRRVR